MNEIVRVTNKPVKVIDALRSGLAKEAWRLSAAIHHWPTSSVDTLAENVAAAEVMVTTPEYSALVGALEAAFAPASVADIKRELGLLFACYPAKDVDISALVACAVDEVTSDQPSVLELQLSARDSAAPASSGRASLRSSRHWTMLTRRWLGRGRSSSFPSVRMSRVGPA